jgi:predicted tellurium resistance membrane protein TerC
MFGLGELVFHLRIVDDFLWLDAVVAARALPRHATVVSPGRCVSVLLLLLLLCITL